MAFFETILSNSWVLLVVSLGFAFVVGFVKGITGFGLPMLMLSGLGIYLSFEVALGCLILPALVTNFSQIARSSVREMVAICKEFKLFIVAFIVWLMLSSRLLNTVSSSELLLVCGVTVTAFAIQILIGLDWRLTRFGEAKAKLIYGSISGFFGGITAIWGPPLVSYLTDAKIEKTRHVQIQGFVYFLGSVVLAILLVENRLLTFDIFVFSCCLVVPAQLGMIGGQQIQNRISQHRFRQYTLYLLLLAGVNLARKGGTEIGWF